MPRLHFVTLLALSLGALYYLSSASFLLGSEAPISSYAYCPPSTTRSHTPTIILRPTGKETDSTRNRTFWVDEHPNVRLWGEEVKAEQPFLPYAQPGHELRFAQQLPANLADSMKHRHKDKRVPSSHGASSSRAVEDNAEDAERELPLLCPVFNEVPASPPLAFPPRWSNNHIMIGMSTLPDRVLYNLPVWSHWLPSLLGGQLDPNESALTKDLPLVLVLTPPTESKVRMTEAMDEAQTLGMHVVMREKEADRFETRYFAMVEEMWIEAKKREETEGVRTEWFIFADDDTFYPDWTGIVRLLSAYESYDDLVIGGLSESTKQVKQWGHIAYGGAGIYVSRALMEKMNAPDAWAGCLRDFGAAFGGDAMISHCAAKVTERTVKDILHIEPTLHQLDIRGDSTGWFQSGFLITSLHHWGSWFTLFPPWHESGMGDQRKGVLMVGKAAKAVGGDNWGRRYVFESGKVVVSLGYSVTIHAKDVKPEDLAASEHTWYEFETFHPIRDGLEEALHKRTYYITGVRKVDDRVYKLEHRNREGQRVDVIWDARGMGKPKYREWEKGAPSSPRS